MKGIRVSSLCGAAPHALLRRAYLGRGAALISRGITSSPVAVPTLAERNGDFSAGPTFSGVLNEGAVAQALINRPGCSAAVSNGGGAAISAGTAYSAIFPGNIIPASDISPQTLALLKYYPTTSVPGASLNSRNYIRNALSPTDSNQFNQRIDWVQNNRSTWFGRSPSTMQS